MFDLIPFGRNKSLWNTFDELEKNFWNSGLVNAGGFKTDVLDQGDHYLLEAELPGFKKEDIHIDIEENYLLITAQTSEEKNEEKKNYVKRERYQRTFTRQFNIADVKADEIAAQYEHGILKVTLPKKDSEQPPKRSIDIR